MAHSKEPKRDDRHSGSPPPNPPFPVTDNWWNWEGGDERFPPERWRGDSPNPKFYRCSLTGDRPIEAGDLRSSECLLIFAVPRHSYSHPMLNRDQSQPPEFGDQWHRADLRPSRSLYLCHEDRCEKRPYLSTHRAF